MEKNIENKKESPKSINSHSSLYSCTEKVLISLIINNNNKKQINIEFTQWHTKNSETNISNQEINKNNISFQNRKKSLSEGSGNLQFISCQQLTEDQNFEKSNLFDVNYTQQTKDESYNLQNETHIPLNEYYRETQNLLKMQTSDNFIFDKIKNETNLNNTVIDSVEKLEDFKTIVSEFKDESCYQQESNLESISTNLDQNHSKNNFNESCYQQESNLESISTNLDQNHSKNNSTETSDGRDQELCKDTLKESCVSQETFFLEKKLSNFDNNKETHIYANEKETSILSDSNIEFDHASSLFKTTDGDEPFFLKNISDSLVIQDKNTESCENVVKNNVFSTQTNYDIWKTIGEDTNFLPDENLYTQNDSESYMSNVKSISDTNTIISNENIEHSLQNNIQDHFNQIPNISYPFYSNNSELNITSSKKHNIASNNQFYMYTNNNQLSSNAYHQSDVLNIDKPKNIPSQFLPSEISHENYFSHLARTQNQSHIYQQPYQLDNNYFSAMNLEHNKKLEKSYVSAKGGYLSPYDLPTQIIPKFRHPINTVSNKYNEVQKHNYSLNYLQTDINTSKARPSKSIQNVSANETSHNVFETFCNRTALKSTIDQKKTLNCASVDTSFSNTNTYSVKHKFKTYEEKQEENKMFQDLPIELSGKPKVLAQNIHKTSYISHIQTPDSETQHTDVQHSTINQHDSQNNQKYYKKNTDVSNTIKNDFFLSKSSNTNTLEIDIKKTDLNCLSLSNNTEKQGIPKKSYIVHENTVKSNEIVDLGTNVLNKTDLYSQHSSLPNDSEKNVSNSENIWNSDNGKSLDSHKNGILSYKCEPYTPLQPNISSTQQFPDINSSHSQQKMKYDALTVSDTYTSFSLSNPIFSDISLDNSLNTNKNNSNICDFYEESNSYHKNFQNANYPLLAWGFGGKIVTIFPNKTNISGTTDHIHQNSSNTSGLLKISNIRSYFQDSELSKMTIPGPLFSISKNTNKAHKKEAIKWIREKIQSLELIDSHREKQSFLDGKILLWKIIYILLDNEFPSQTKTIHSILNLLCPDLQLYNEESKFTIIADFINSDYDLNKNIQEISSCTVTQDYLEQIKLHLLNGSKNNALQFCLDKKLWSHALLISSSMDRGTWNYVAKEFISSEINISNKSLQSLKFFYETLCENDSKIENFTPFFKEIVNTHSNEIDECHQDHLNSWKEKLAIILSNPSNKDSDIIRNLGNSLIKNNHVIAGHICFLLAKKDTAFSMFDIPDFDIILFGKDHLKDPLFYRDLDSIVLNEILELYTAFKSQSPFYGYSHLQVYKFYYTTVLTDFGYIYEAQRYCESINDIIKKCSKNSFFHPLFIQQFQEFSSRFLTCESIDSLSWFGKKVTRPKLDSFWGSIENKFSRFVAGEISPTESQEISNSDSKPFARLAEKISFSRIQSHTNLETLNVTNHFLTQNQGICQQDSQEKTAKTCQNGYKINHNSSVTNFQNHSIMPKNRDYNNLAHYQPIRTSNKASNQDGSNNNNKYYQETVISENNSGNIVDRQHFTGKDELKQSKSDNSSYSESINMLSNESYNTGLELQNFDANFELQNSYKPDFSLQDPNGTESESQHLEKNKDENVNSGWFSRWWGKKEQPKEKKVYKAKLGENNSFVYDVKLKKWVNQKDDASTSKQDILPPPPKKESLCSSELMTKKSQSCDELSNKLQSNTFMSSNSEKTQFSIESIHNPITSDGNTLDDILEMASKRSLTIGNTQGKSLNKKTRTHIPENTFSIPLQSIKNHSTERSQTSIDNESYNMCSQIGITEDDNDEIPLINNDNIQSFDVLSHTSFSINLSEHKKHNSANKPCRKIPIVSSLSASTTSYNYPSNVISNAKYNIFTFIPMFLYEQFKHFLNLYFLLIALSQFIIPLRIGYLSTYIAPLIFVISITMGKELLDDLARRKRDNEANSEPYIILGNNSLKKSRDLKVGDLIVVQKNKRIPSDILLLHTNNPNGECFIKTDQLDGETDWKLKIATAATQSFSSSESLFSLNATVYAGPPIKSIHMFFGTLSIESSKNIHNYPLTVDNMLWANTVLASGGPITGLVIYTGIETRQAMNTSKAGTKTGLLESEINNLTKILCALTFVLSSVLVLLNVSYQLDKVNLDLGKSVYAYQIEHDSELKGTVVRTSTIPEDLGRIEYLLTDKTGTLTQNDMKMKKLHIGILGYTDEAMTEVAAYIREEYKNNYPNTQHIEQKVRKEVGNRIRDIVFALSVCHNVTPTIDLSTNTVSYQSSSPDEMAIVQWTSSMGLVLHQRDRHTIQLCHQHTGKLIKMKILHIFPFTSKSKRMGIIIQIIKNSDKDGDIWFFQKGADTVMRKIVTTSDWLDEECNNIAREGLRTLVIGRKKLSKETYDIFVKDYTQAALNLYDRNKAIAEVISKFLECDLELLGVTGVEDRLQKDVKPSLELLRNAGIKIWMLTGDKAETAKCVAVNSKFATLILTCVLILTMSAKSKDYIIEQLNFLKDRKDLCLLIDGESLQLYLDFYKAEFISIAAELPSVIACRCTPTQKADVAKLIQKYTHCRVCCIGDGGNDVSMIQAANVGIGIVGKEGHQASLAADFSITQFYHLPKLLVWHGRNSYKRSAKLTRFIIHRGLLISICQACYSILSGFTPIVLFKGWLMVGYATLYTMAPIFSLVLDRDVNECLAFLYPELYKELTNGKTLNYKTFFIWVFISVYQGISIMLLSIIFIGLDRMKTTVTVTFTALILNELIMVIIEICTWHKVMIIAEIATIIIYIISIPFLNDYFDLNYIKTIEFLWKTTAIISISLIPPWIAKTLRRKIKPPNYAKLQV
ncbi:hypothetical protein PORY_001659 [Pneumocystis oryctolagi]|uniref:Uncharacterized protein n=1 Tax=Pneumocystis oryctolagi TaxID=42067 RepID=A0ACB7CHV0_9ASCO|nr:hypothetical protein PORY_001659 [Pneumocystis oryctolagi]